MPWRYADSPVKANQWPCKLHSMWLAVLFACRSLSCMKVSVTHHRCTQPGLVVIQQYKVPSHCFCMPTQLGAAQLAGKAPTYSVATNSQELKAAQVQMRVMFSNRLRELQLHCRFSVCCLRAWKQPCQQATKPAASTDSPCACCRLRKRQLYKYCSEVVVPPGFLNSGQWHRPLEQDVVSCAEGGMPLKVGS